jgi:cell fate (sporulation/competence/biofilm development) regulator YmcA (YheA/YmcA/DUF963 family)
MNNFDNLIKLIEQSDEYIEYKRLKELVSNNSDINKLSNEIKGIQKKIVNLECNGISISKERKELELKNIELKNIPLYNDYIDALDKLNDLLLIVREKFNKFISELLLEV